MSDFGEVEIDCEQCAGVVASAVGKFDCIAGCGRSFWVCESCAEGVKSAGGLVCGPCAPSYGACLRDRG